MNIRKITRIRRTDRLKGGSISNEPKWLEYAKILQSIAQSGLEYSKDRYDIERFEKIRNISIDILSHYTEMEHDKIKDLFASETGYQTPKIDVRAAVFRDDSILLVKEKLDGLWSLPGGWRMSTSLRENIIEECMEEAGARVKPKRIIAILIKRRTMHCRLLIAFIRFL